MYSTKFRAVSQDYRLALFFQHGIDHIGTHHIATGKPSFRLPAINTNKCFAEMHLLDALACQRANHTFAFFLAELIAAILVLFGAYQVLDAWIARVSLEEREALEARQQAMMEGQQEGGHVSH